MVEARWFGDWLWVSGGKRVKAPGGHVPKRGKFPRDEEGERGK